MDQSTGKPLSGVHVRMVTGDFGGNGGVNAVYGATSDDTGRFAAENMKPGLYLMMADRVGFIQVTAAEASPIGVSMLTLKAGQHLTGYKVVMTARALIAGRVVDEYGDPLDNVSVQIQPAAADRPQMAIFGRPNSVTDDRGEFRLITAPGKYYLRASVFNQRGTNGEIRTDGTSGAPFVTTYYPSAANTGAASVVQVVAGQDLAAVEIRMMRSALSGPGRGLTISGMVTGAPDNGRPSVIVRYGDTAGQLYSSRGTTAGPDGKFALTGMQPGFYNAIAVYSSGATSMQSRVSEFHLSASDETNLQLVLTPGEELTGTLVLVGNGTAGASERRTVRLEATGGFNPMGQAESPAVEVGKDGLFRISNIAPGKHRPVVEPMQENEYVKEVALDGKPLADGVLDFSQGAAGSRLKITVSRGGGQLSGRILDKDGEPSVSMTMVYLMTDPKNVELRDADRVSNGKYSFKAIRPGKYRLFALDVLELMPAMAGGNQDDGIKPFFDAAEEIELKEGDRVSKDVTAWTKMPEKKEANAAHQ